MTLTMIGLFFLFSGAQAEDFKPNYEAKIDSKLKELDFRFNQGQVQIKYDFELKRNDVKCELSPNAKPKSGFHFEGDYKKFRCEITLSREIKMNVKGKSGQIQAIYLPTDADLSLVDGQIQFTGDSTQNYQYDATVENGMKPMMPMGSHSSNRNPIAIKLHVKNGMISIQ